ncbi:MAG: hypothetical protein HYY13_02610 [Nitrospirae bacterium]|nr:hypothetical protein [Nitrospirota bacterium]
MRRRGDERRNGYVTRSEFLHALKELREDFAGRFEAMDKRFEALRDWVGIVVGGFQNRAGKNLEDTVAGAMQLALGMYDIQPEHLKLRQRLRDPEGRIGPPGREYEIDILVRNGEAYVFEIKSTVDEEQVLRFNDKAELAIGVMGLRGAHKVLVTLAKDPWLIHECSRLGIRLV